MGTCASKSGVLKNVDDGAPLPVAEKEAIVEVNEKDETAPPAVDGDEDKRQSLGVLFKENEEGKEGETKVKPQESSEAAAVVETEREPEKHDVLKPETSEENVAGVKVSDEKVLEEKPVETSEKSDEPEESEKEDKKPEEKSEAETTEEEKTEDDKKGKDNKKPLFKLWF